jgi:3-oxoacyl-ACP reductase-like protein
VSDRLTLANAIEDAGIERAKAERVASAIIDIIHDNVATKADVQAVRADLQTAVQAVRGELQTAETRLNGQIAAVRADLALVEHRLMTRLGGLAVVLSGLLFAALR